MAGIAPAPLALKPACPASGCGPCLVVARVVVAWVVSLGGVPGGRLPRGRSCSAAVAIVRSCRHLSSAAGAPRSSARCRGRRPTRCQTSRRIRQAGAEQELSRSVGARPGRRSGWCTPHRAPRAPRARRSPRPGCGRRRARPAGGPRRRRRAALHGQRALPGAGSICSGSSDLGDLVGRGRAARARRRRAPRRRRRRPRPCEPGVDVAPDPDDLQAEAQRVQLGGPSRRAGADPRPAGSSPRRQPVAGHEHVARVGPLGDGGQHEARPAGASGGPCRSGRRRRSARRAAPPQRADEDPGAAERGQLAAVPSPPVADRHELHLAARRRARRRPAGLGLRQACARVPGRIVPSALPRVPAMARGAGFGEPRSELVSPRATRTRGGPVPP